MEEARQLLGLSLLLRCEKLSDAVPLPDSSGFFAVLRMTDG